MNRTLLRVAGLGALFGLCFLIGLFVLFPMDLAARVVEAQAEKATRFRYDLEVGSVGLAGLNGIRLTDVSVRPNEPSPDGKPTIPLRFDEMSVSVGLVSLLRARPSAHIELVQGDGRVTADIAPGEEEGTRRLDIAAFDLDVRKLDMIRVAVGMPVQGTINGTVAATLAGNGKTERADVDLSVSGLVFGPGELKMDALKQVGGGVPLPATDFGTLAVKGAFDGQSVQFEQFEASGRDVRLQVSGSIQTASPFVNSRARLEVRFSLDQAYVEKAGLSGIFTLVPMLQRAQTDDGWALAIIGPLRKPAIEPLGSSRANRPGRKAPG